MLLGDVHLVLGRAWTKRQRNAPQSQINVVTHDDHGIPAHPATRPTTLASADYVVAIKAPLLALVLGGTPWQMP
jgi:hypothetical protein